MAWVREIKDKDASVSFVEVIELDRVDKFVFDIQGEGLDSNQSSIFLEHSNFADKSFAEFPNLKMPEKLGAGNDSIILTADHVGEWLKITYDAGSSTTGTVNIRVKRRL